jgi:hypothetical protein
LGIAAFCVSIVGYILAWIASFSCWFFTIKAVSYGYYDDYETSYGIGLWCASVGGTGYSYTYENLFISGATKFARAMSIMATILGFLAFVPTLCLSCMSMPNLILKSVAILWVISGLCIILMLTAMVDCKDYYDDTCKIGPGAALAIVAPLFYLGVAAIVFKIPLYESDSGATAGSKGPPGKNVTIEITSLPDGSKKTVKTTIDKNGIKTIEETIEEPREEQYPEEEEVVRRVLPDGSIKTTRTTYDEEGCKIVTETIEISDESA